jgi:hypothetical protein
MKKLLLMLSAMGILATNVDAQTAQKSVVFQGSKYQVKTPVENHLVNNTKKLGHSTAGSNKTTSGVDPRWYSQFAFYDDNFGNALSASPHLIPIWFDSTIMVSYSNGRANVNFASVSTTIDPKGALMFNDPQVYPGQLAISSTTPYNVDSVYVDAAYIRMPNKTNIVDTLWISVSSNQSTYYWPSASYTWVANYTSNDTLWTPAPTAIDSVNRAAFSDGTSAPARVIWPVYLTAADGDTVQADGSVNLKTYTYAVPSTFTVPANSRVSVTYTFKSGDNWNRNVDSIDSYNRFEPIAGGSANAMDYNWVTYGDRSGTALMFTTDTSWYVPSMVVEAINQISFNYEYLSAGAKLSCATCNGVNVKNISSNIYSVTAFPNPANNTVAIPVTMKQDASVTVSLLNSVGQVVKTQNLGKVNANQKATAQFSTSDLAQGVYFYSVNADGQNMNGRISVVH